MTQPITKPIKPNRTLVCAMRFMFFMVAPNSFGSTSLASCAGWKVLSLPHEDVSRVLHAAREGGMGACKIYNAASAIDGCLVDSMRVRELDRSGRRD